MVEQSALSPAIVKHARATFERHGQQGSLDAYLSHLNAPESSAALPIALDTSHPISHYFISSSHNTYLSGNQLWSKSSGDSYKEVLKQGCRCVEVDIWDGDSPSSSEAEAEHGTSKPDNSSTFSGILKKKLNRIRSRSDTREPESDIPTTDSLMPTPWRTASDRSEPVVYHGYTATKEMTFRKVCEVVRQYAFCRSNLPLIVSLEVHCSTSQQEIVCELMQDYWGEFLYTRPHDFSDATPLPALESLRNKILVKVKFSPPEKAKKVSTAVSIKGMRNGDDDSATSEEESENTKKSNIIEPLSNMGIFTRAFHFRGFDDPAASIPTHVFSLGESKLLKASEEQYDQLFRHNLRFLMRAYPKGTRLRSTNLDPVPFWRHGVQMVALNFQKLNAANMLNAAQFESTGGFVLKPCGFLPSEAEEQPRPRRRSLDLTVNVLAAQALGSEKDNPSSYVKCELHVESKAELESNKIPDGGKNKGGEWKRKTQTVGGRDPEYGQTLDFHGVHGIMEELSFLRLHRFRLPT